MDIKTETQVDLCIITQMVAGMFKKVQIQDYQEFYGEDTFLTFRNHRG